MDWDEFCTYMMIQFKEHDDTTKHGKSFSPKLNITRIIHNKETTTRILRDFNPMRYVTVSKVRLVDHQGVDSLFDNEHEYIEIKRPDHV